MKYVVGFFLIFSALITHAQPFINKKGGYQITIPVGWVVQKEDEITSVYAPDVGDMDTWKEKVEISLTDANDLNLEEAFTFYVEQDLPALYDGITILKKGEENINGLKSKWLVFSFTQNSNVFCNAFYLIEKKQ